MWQLEKLVSGEVEPGVYRYRGLAHPSEMRDALADFNWHFYYLDGRMITDKASFMTEMARALALPGYGGRNWDAFEEMLRDLNWDRAYGYVLLYEYPQYFANSAPSDWAIALSILQSACRFWGEQGMPMYVLLRRVDRQLQEIPVL
jgi:hypothetical protein